MLNFSIFPSAPLQLNRGVRLSALGSFACLLFAVGCWFIHLITSFAMTSNFKLTMMSLLLANFRAVAYNANNQRQQQQRHRLKLWSCFDKFVKQPKKITQQQKLNRHKQVLTGQMEANEKNNNNKKLTSILFDFSLYSISVCLIQR